MQASGLTVSAAVCPGLVRFAGLATHGATQARWSMSDESTAGLVCEDRFTIVPEWVLDADISDAAVRLYAVLLRYGQTSGARMPSRATPATGRRKRSVDSVDRASRELTRVGAVTVRGRYRGGQRLTNLHQVRTSRPQRPKGRTATVNIDQPISTLPNDWRHSSTGTPRLLTRSPVPKVTKGRMSAYATLC